jgi:hypothetical protein
MSVFLSDRPLRHGGRLISVVVVAHALLTTACICYYTGAMSHTLHKQAATRYWCWSTVVVGAESLVSSLSCAPSAAAELGARICAAPSSLCCTGGNRLFNPVSLICVRYKAATYKYISRAGTKFRLLQAKSRTFESSMDGDGAPPRRGEAV